MWLSNPDFGDLLHAAQRSAVHLEMRDTYAVDDEDTSYTHFLATGEMNLDPDSAFWREWTSIVRETVSREVEMRRARIVSVPVTDYIRYEHAGTPANLAAGEQVRWLPRRHTCDIALPGNDFWLFDDNAVLFNHFSGTGSWDEPRWSATRDRAVVDLCTTAFKTVWDRATPHADFSL